MAGDLEIRFTPEERREALEYAHTFSSVVPSSWQKEAIHDILGLGNSSGFLWLFDNVCRRLKAEHDVPLKEIEYLVRRVLAQWLDEGATCFVCKSKFEFLSRSDWFVIMVSLDHKYVAACSSACLESAWRSLEIEEKLFAVALLGGVVPIKVGRLLEKLLEKEGK